MTGHTYPLQKMFLGAFPDVQGFLEEYIKYNPILEDYERKAISDEQYEKIKARFMELAEKRIREFVNIEPKKTDAVIFVVKQKETMFDSKEDEYLHSFLCKKEDIKEKGYLDFSLWNDEKPRIEHYAYDFSPIEEIMGCDVYLEDDNNIIFALFEIFRELTFNGLTEESSEARKEEILESIKEAEEDIKAGRTYTMEEVFEKLDAEILEGASEEEREQILKDRAERKKNEPRNNRYSSVVMMYNHNVCIQAIRAYYLENFKAGIFTLE